MIQLSVESLNDFFPAFIEIDAEGVIRSCGPSLKHHLQSDVSGESFFDQFRVFRPAGIESVDQIRNHTGPILIGHERLKGLLLRGAVLLQDARCYLLVGHIPNLTAPGVQLKYRFSDFAHYDGSQDTFLAAQLRKAILEDTQALAQQLKQEKVAAEAANIAKSNFLACISHEIKTPLNSILGMADVLLKMEPRPEQTELLEVIGDSGRNLLSILNDILDISKIESGHMEVVNVDFDLDDLLGGMEKVYSLECRQKDVSIKFDVEPGLKRTVYNGDALRIRQIITNLVANAVKFTEKGSIDVQMTETQLVAGAPALRCKVTDSGIGIDDETMKKLFAPFVQADSSTTRRYGGTGLGLSISKKLCELLGGLIEVESAAGLGSTFVVTIPVQHAAGERLPDPGRRVAAE